MMRLPEDIFKECAEIMGGKRHDYVTGPVHENFERSAEVSSWFNDVNDKVYVTLIATKLARLATLLGKKLPRNESIRDTFKDLINYCALWADSRDERDEIAIEGPERYDDQRIHEEIAKSYTESITKPADIVEHLNSGLSSVNACKIIDLCTTLTPEHLRQIVDYTKLLVRDMDYSKSDRP